MPEDHLHGALAAVGDRVLHEPDRRERPAQAAPERGDRLGGRQRALELVRGEDDERTGHLDPLPRFPPRHPDATLDYRENRRREAPMAQRATSAIITCAPTGAIHTPTMSPALPITPEQIAEAALGAAAAGAAIVHLHVRDPEDGHPVQDPGLFKEVLAIVKDSSDVVINLTTGGSPHMTVDERIAPAVQLAPELASLNMGSMNFGLFPMLDRYPEFKYEWERERLADKDVVFKNTYADIERILKLCGDQGTRFEFECYDTAHLYNLANMLDRGLVRPPAAAAPRPAPPAALRADRVRPARRHRQRPRGPRPHAPDGAAAVRRPVRVVGARRRLRADALGHHRAVPRRQRPRRTRGLAVGRAGQAGRVQRRPGRADHRHRPA